MKFDFWTFAFQVINFTVLLFILRRLLYKPVWEIMEKRRAHAARTMVEAETARKEAEELKARNQTEMEQLHLQRGQMMEEMKAAVAQERQKMLADAGHEAERLIDKEQALFDAEKKRYGAELREKAIDAVGLFAANIFRDIADEELHHAICRRLPGEMERIAAELRNLPMRDEALDIEVISAYPLAEEEERALHDALAAGAGRKVSMEATVDRELMAGVKVRAYDMIYDSSLSGQVAALTVKLKESA
jgi:F-type H+-transporting ATPase subunit b